VRYIYKISSEDLVLERAFFRILDHELFDFFKKSNLLISDYAFTDVISNGDGVRQIVFYPKSDVSLVDFQKAYDVFVNRVCDREITSDTFQKIELLNSYSLQFLTSDLHAVYAKIKNDYLNGIDEEMEFSESKRFNLFCEKILKQNLILKIVTRYKADK
jgi:hypothetical protein